MEYLDPRDIWTPRPKYFRNIWIPSEIIYPPIKLFIVHVHVKAHMHEIHELQYS